jgi:hypothetical protein
LQGLPRKDSALRIGGSAGVVAAEIDGHHPSEERFALRRRTSPGDEGRLGLVNDRTLRRRLFRPEQSRKFGQRIVLSGAKGTCRPQPTFKFIDIDRRGGAQRAFAHGYPLRYAVASQPLRRVFARPQRARAPRPF